MVSLKLNRPHSNVCIYGMGDIWTNWQKRTKSLPSDSEMKKKVVHEQSPRHAYPACSCPKQQKQYHIVGSPWKMGWHQCVHEVYHQLRTGYLANKSLPQLNGGRESCQKNGQSSKCGRQILRVGVVVLIEELAECHSWKDDLNWSGKAFTVNFKARK